MQRGSAAGALRAAEGQHPAASPAQARASRYLSGLHGQGQGFARAGARQPPGKRYLWSLTCAQRRAPSIPAAARGRMTTA